MKKYSLIVVFNKELNKVLMCKRAKEPYKNLYNFPGGKIEKNETVLSSSKRELLEETGLNCKIKRIMKIDYFLEKEKLRLEICTGISDTMDVIPEINKLFWIDISEDFSSEKFAGEGNCKHILKCALFYWGNLT